MRLGLAGTGRIGARHAEILHRIDEVDSLVLADADVARARGVAAGLDAEFTEDTEELFGRGIDGLVVAAATDAHPKLILRAVEAGIPVFCEKPVAKDVAGTIEVLDRIRGTGVEVQVGFQRRFDAGYAAAREAVGSGAVGRVHTLRATTLDPAPPPAEYIPRSGGLFRDCGVHDYDIIRWVTGREIVEAYALGTNRGAEFFAEAGDVDTGAAVLTLDDDTLALTSAGRYNGAGYDVRLEVLGSRGSIAAGLDDRLPMRSAEPGVSWPPGPAHPGFLERFHPAYVRELETFVDVVAGRAASPCTVSDALEAFYVAEACELSRHQRRPVRLAELR
ncbi:Gfo/Idh/MocA family protein [Amycolatopsis cihanbeyliensis]|uniref:Myo-inositol 2-dehydrogenase/D-chiro-inositol 1-dehydrogenase n=1 Tax=Amycolatopsis cihanbeyliensis TaxID=1128664 RepID=A0A542CUB4_AMYCI|nr:Gfo/Idh/MocA family oxidoreductase [Amycolatopsis cihanbeyliensis]TQI94380.1 myo-inositol 2-dehydrogenase/D-chiro-inositol 1-dehydrogenase [Amycolatopsis cihanbeyliensis]